MRHLSIVLTAACFVVATTASCVRSPERAGDGAPDADSDVSAINAAYERSVATQKDGDIDGWLALFSEDIVFMPPDQTIVEGKEAIRAIVEPFQEQFNIEESTSLDEIQVSGDWAFTRGTRDFRATPKAGGDTMQQRVKFVHVLRRHSDGTWKFSRWIWNGDGSSE